MKYDNTEILRFPALL